MKNTVTFLMTASSVLLLSVIGHAQSNIVATSSQALPCDVTLPPSPTATTAGLNSISTAAASAPDTNGDGDIVICLQPTVTFTEEPAGTVTRPIEIIRDRTTLTSTRRGSSPTLTASRGLLINVKAKKAIISDLRLEMTGQEGSLINVSPQAELTSASRLALTHRGTFGVGFTVDGGARVGIIEDVRIVNTAPGDSSVQSFSFGQFSSVGVFQYNSVRNASTRGFGVHSAGVIGEMSYNTFEGGAIGINLYSGRVDSINYLFLVNPITGLRSMSTDVGVLSDVFGTVLGNWGTHGGPAIADFLGGNKVGAVRNVRASIPDGAFGLRFSDMSVGLISGLNIQGSSCRGRPGCVAGIFPLVLDRSQIGTIADVELRSWGTAINLTSFNDNSQRPPTTVEYLLKTQLITRDPKRAITEEDKIKTQARVVKRTP